MKTITAETIDGLIAKAAATPRKRTNLNLHAVLSDPVSRFLNAGTAGTYTRPHRHDAARWELFVILRGRLDILIFSEDGAVAERFALTPAELPVVEIPGGRWHTVVSMTPSTVALEVKPGPYDPATDKDFAGWAPAEGDPRAADFLAWLEAAASGARWRG